MSLTAFRGSSRALALWLLLVTMCGLPHRAEDTDTCAPAGIEQHDESKHVFSSEPDDEHGDHCAVCHWLRSVNPDLAPRGAVGAQPDLASRLVAGVPPASADPIRRQLAARAPPRHS